MSATESIKSRNSVEEFKKFVIQQTNEEIIDDGKIPPVLNILCYDPRETKPVLALIPIPGDLFRNERTKDALANVVIPQVLNKLEDEGVEPMCISMITEGWVWESDKNEKLDIAEIKRTKEKKEVVMISFETKDKCEVLIFDKMGTKKNAEGEYIEGVYLKPRTDISDAEPVSRFANLFKKAR